MNLKLTLASIEALFSNEMRVLLHLRAVRHLRNTVMNCIGVRMLTLILFLLIVIPTMAVELPPVNGSDAVDVANEEIVSTPGMEKYLNPLPEEAHATSLKQVEPLPGSEILESVALITVSSALPFTQETFVRRSTYAQSAALPDSSAVSGSTNPQSVNRTSHLLISEVFYDPDSGNFNDEWIELYNPTDQAILLDQLRLGDEEAQGGGEGMYYFPDGSGSIPAHGMISVANKATFFFDAYGFYPDFEFIISYTSVPTLSRDIVWSSGSINLGNSGDEVLLLQADYTVIDVVTYGTGVYPGVTPHPDVALDHSIERCPCDVDTDDCSSDFIDQANEAPEVCCSVNTPTNTPTTVSSSTPTPLPTSTPTLTPTNTRTYTPTVTPTQLPTILLLISEVFYNPTSGLFNDEWVEIYNPTNQPITLDQLRFGDEETQGGGEGMYYFPDGSGSIPAHGFVIVANKATFFNDAYGFNPDYEFVTSDSAVPDLPRDLAWASGTINLGNTGDEMLLMQADYTVIDVVTYGTGVYAGVTPHPGVALGHSIERCPCNVDTNNCATDFVDQTTVGPGACCSQQTPTNTPTAVSTNTPTMLPTHTQTIAPTNTLTVTPSNTPTHSPTRTSTPIPTNTSTAIPTSTPTTVNTLSPTIPPTRTATPSPTQPYSPSPTTTPAPTAIPAFNAIGALALLLVFGFIFQGIRIKR